MRPILNELPQTLDETYGRILQEIPRSNRLHAHRLLQCLTVAVRPLRVEELAEVLAVDFGATGGIPKLNEYLRWEDQEQAVLSACTSLIAVVSDGSSRVVQFSHFSVKEFLTSDRLTTSTTDTSHYHILLEPSHEIMARACLSVLLRLDTHINRYNLENFPLAWYASQYFGDHVEFGNVLAHIRDGIDDLLDADKPHFTGWLWVHRADLNEPPKRPEASPLYHIAGFGFRAMVDHLISKRPDDLSVRGHYGIPLHAALCNGHGSVALLLLGHCVDVDVRGIDDRTPLHMAVDHGLLEVTRILIERGANINARDSRDRTPLHPTSGGRSGTFDDTYFDVVRYLLDHGADVDTQANTEHSTPLHLASYWGGFRVAQLLLNRGVNIDVRDERCRTPLHEVLTGLGDSSPDYFVDAARFLLDHGADVDAEDNNRSTPLHVISQHGNVKAARLLLGHGACVDALDDGHSTPLHFASQGGNVEVARVLLEHGANINSQNKKGQTPKHLLLTMRGDNLPDLDTIRFFIERGADVDAVDDDHSTLLHKASSTGNVNVAQLLLEHGVNINVRNGEGHTPMHRGLMGSAAAHSFDMTQLLLEHGADLNALDDTQSTPLHVALQYVSVEPARLLLKHGARVDALDNDHSTPLHVASRSGNAEAAALLLEHGADVHALDGKHSTPLHFASESGSAEAARLLLEHGADVHALDNNNSTPLHFTARHGNDGAARVLLEHGAVVDARDNEDSTPLHVASQYGNAETARILLEHGADVHALNGKHVTPLHFASESGRADATRLLLEHSADVHALDNNNSTPLHLMSWYDNDSGSTRVLLGHGAVVDARNNENSTPLHVASQRGNASAVRLLLEHGADVHALDNKYLTPLHFISRCGNAVAACILLEHGAVVDARDNEDSTPLHVASQNGKAEVARILLEHGANMHVQNKENQTPQRLLLAMWRNGSVTRNIDTIRFFLERGADVDAVDEDHSTLLHFASYHGRGGVARVLLEHGANINVRNGKDQTPLHQALVGIKNYNEDSHLYLIQLLLEHGADVDALDNDHSTPLHLASQSGSVRATRRLLKHGANIHILNNDGHTPSQVASANGHEEISRLLSEPS